MRFFCLINAALASLMTLTLGASAKDCDTIAALETYLETGSAVEASQCGTYLSELGTQAAYCHWEFNFRDTLAQAEAERIWQEITACRAGFQLKEDFKVNHPDSFEPRSWSSKQGIYRLSIKDKSALNRTLVFIAFERSR